MDVWTGIEKIGPLAVGLLGGTLGMIGTLAGAAIAAVVSLYSVGQVSRTANMPLRQELYAKQIRLYEELVTRLIRLDVSMRKLREVALQNEEGGKKLFDRGVREVKGIKRHLTFNIVFLPIAVYKAGVNCASNFLKSAEHPEDVELRKKFWPSLEAFVWTIRHEIGMETVGPGTIHEMVSQLEIKEEELQLDSRKASERTP